MGWLLKEWWQLEKKFEEGAYGLLGGGEKNTDHGHDCMIKAPLLFDTTKIRTGLCFWPSHGLPEEQCLIWKCYKM